MRLRRILARLANLFHNTRAERELAREVASHLALMADDFENRGMSREDAQLAAKRAYGGVEQAKQAHRNETLSLVDRAHHAGPSPRRSRARSQPRLHAGCNCHNRARSGHQHHVVHRLRRGSH